MENNKVWFITGAGRGLGKDIAKAALEAGHKVIATGRNPEAVTAALGKADNLFVTKLDITNIDEARHAAQLAVERFGSIDVLVNNAANFYAGFFEEVYPKEMEAQIATSLYGPMNVTSALLPVMRKQRSGHIITISSTAGLVGAEFTSAYAASKFAVEGWMSSLQPEVEPFGITTTIVNPGFFRTELLTDESTKYADATIDDYKEKHEATKAFYGNYSGQQIGDPAKLAKALITIASEAQPPLRFIAGNDALAAAEQVAKTLLEQANAYRELSSSLAHNDTK